MQEAFREHHGLQCGFCTPGMIMTAVDMREPQAATARRDDDPRGARGQYLPLHGLPQHRQGDRRRRARRWARRPRRRGQAGRAEPLRGPSGGAALNRLALRSVTVPWPSTQTPHRRAPPRADGGNTMSATGIGAAVRRKEDLRFITGQGRYTDDINRPGQAHAYFLRSPHAHATIKSIDTTAAAGDARRARHLHRRRPRRRQDRRPDLRLDDPLQGRLADEGRPASGARPGQGALCRRPRRRRRRRDAARRPRDAAEAIVVDYEVLPAVVDTAKAVEARAAGPRRRAGQHRVSTGTSATRPRPRRPSQGRQARHQARPRQQPAGAERDGAARRGRRLRPGTAPSRSTPPARTRMWRGSCSRPSSASRRSTSCA